MRRLNLVTKKIGMAMICASLLISGMTFAACGSAQTDSVSVSESSDASASNAGASDDTDGETTSAKTDSAAAGTGMAYKDETVYVTTDLSGKTSAITVSDWLKNNDNYKTLTDTTTLSDVTNVKGDETIEQSGNKLTIDADGSDIYYQGDVAATSELPVEFDITYKLNGKTISAADLQGKSGKVEITIKYKNNEKTTVDGEEVYIPFMAATGLLMDSDNFSNIRVENGKVVSNGYYQAVIGYGLPGLNESLGLKGDDAIFTDEVVITADATDYNVDTIMSFYSASAFSDLDFDDVSDLDDLEDSLNKLADSSKELVSGTEELSDGAKSLYDGLVELSDGANTLASGTSSFDSNYKTFDSSYKTFDSSLSQLDTALGTLNSKMSSMYDQIDAAITTYTELAESAPKLAAAYSADDAESTYGGDIQKAMYLTKTYGKPDYDELTQAYSALEKYYSAYEQYTAAGDADNAAQAAAAAQQYAVAYNTGCASYYESAAQQAKGAAAALQTIKDAMDTKDKSTGLDTKGSLAALESAGDKLASASSQLSSASSQLSSASSKIKSGASQLADGASSAKSGSSDLYDGAVELKEGMAKFDKEGIQKIVDAYNGDLKDVIDKLESVVDAGKDYNTYTTLGEGQEGTVTFVVTSK